VGGAPGQAASPPAPSPGAPASAAASAASARAALDLAHGESIYRDACQACHGVDGGGGQGGGPTLLEGHSAAFIVGVATDGRNNMPSFASDYSAGDLNDVAGYILQKLAAK
jgi:cytochrome c551